MVDMSRFSYRPTKQKLKLLCQLVGDVLAANIVQFVDGFRKKLDELEFFVGVFCSHYRIDIRGFVRTIQLPSHIIT